MLKRSLLTCLFITILSALGVRVMAQGLTTASISGLVTDEKGEGLPGATVIAVHTPSGTQYATATRGDGRFNLPAVRVGGPYTIAATFVGYQEQKREGISLALGQNYTFDVKLNSSDVQLSEVVVTGTGNPILNSDRTGAATNISREQIQSLPTLSRSFNDYVRLTPQANGNSFGGRSSGFNNITIDGAVFNNAFGLSGTVGGQTNAQPISLDAVDQISVSIAPYDVTQGSFTGAGVNVVTRSGTNDFSGSAYYFTRNQSLIGSQVGGVENEVAEFNLGNYGFRLGGPIIKNKLFFFINGELERRNDPPTPSFIASRDGVGGSNVSSASAQDLNDLRTFLIDQFQYDPGPYEGYKLASNSDKATAKLDWNITNNHRFSIKYNYLSSYRDVNPSNSGALNNGRNPSSTNLPFLGAFYRINNNLNSVIAELNSSFGNKYSNRFQAGFTAFRDFRETPTSGRLFPLVDIGNGSGSQLTAFGYEPFSANNILNTDVFQISDNFDLYLGKHTVTLGTYNEFYKFQNGFSPRFYGNYQFNSLQDFYDNVNGVTRPNLVNAANPTGLVQPARYQLSYSTAPDGSFPLVETRAMQLGFYAQDKIQITPNVTTTFGLRADIPIINADIARNEEAAGLTFNTGEGINTGQLQKAQVLWSPRAGFNWDVKGDRTTQVRGGTGIFTGRVPYVWISNQASNNGVLFNSLDYRPPGSVAVRNGETVVASPAVQFSPDVDAYRPGRNGNPPASASNAYNLAVTDENFSFPQVWRSNIAVDQQLPWNVVGTLEFAYTKDINAVYHANVNLPEPALTAAGLDGAGADNRPIYYAQNVNPTTGAVSYATNNRIYANISDAILMQNTNKGYSYFVTAQLQKTFTSGLFASVAYTYSDARSVNDGGSIAQSIWRDRVVSGDPNANVLANTQFLQKHRVVASASYGKEYLGFLKTTVSAFYELGPQGFSSFPAGYFSYTYANDMNGDGNFGNDLIYIPRNEGEIQLADLYRQRDRDGNFTNTVGTARPRGFESDPVYYTKEAQWQDLDAYISQDKYLNGRRGQYAERNGVQMPWRGQLDVRLLQDFFVNVAGKRNSIQVSLDIFNFGNMLNSKWGVFKSPVNTSPISFDRINPANGQPVFFFPYRNVASQTPLQSTFQDSFNVASRWQMQLGVRYIFN